MHMPSGPGALLLCKFLILCRILSSDIEQFNKSNSTGICCWGWVSVMSCVCILFSIVTSELNIFAKYSNHVLLGIAPQ